MRVADYDIFADYHTHTCFSHGKGTVMENVATAARLGLQEMAISDHGPANLFGVGVADLTVFNEIHKEVKRANERYPRVKVLVGVEANVVTEDGDLDIPLRAQEGFDVVLVGLHPMVHWRDIPAGVDLLARNIAGRWVPRCKEEARWRNTRAIVNAVLNNRVHAVTHPGYRLSIDTRELARACAKTGCAMEINSGHQHTTVEYIRVAKEEGARFILGSDAHSPERVGDLGRSVALAKAAGLAPGDIVNVREAEEE